MTYDELHRVLSKTYSDSTPSYSFYYDWNSVWGNPITNPIGRMVLSTTSGVAGTELFSYDSRGRTVKHWQCVPRACGYELDYTYNFAGGITSQSVNGVTISYAFDSAGRTSQVTSNVVDAQHPATLATINSFTPAGAVSQMTYGNGLVETSAYNNRLQPTQLRTYNSTTSADILNLTYGFTTSGGANNGNIVTLDSSATQTFMRSYTYDELNRLSTMSSPSDASGCYGLSWSYDAWANRLSQSPTSGACASPSHGALSNNRIADTGYTYDASGNTLTDGSHGYAYDAENRLVSLDSGAATYLYNANGQRIAKTTSAGLTEYLYDLAGNVVMDIGVTGTPVEDYVYLNGSLIVDYKPGATYFVHKDHLGSTRVITALNGSVYDSMDYLPFGEQIAGGSGSTHKFTGKEHDAESGLDNFEARYFSSSLGRFGSPDPLMNSGRPDSPQSWNRYTYTLNNPLNFTDPTGLYVWSAGLGGNAADGDVSADILDKRKHFRSALGDAFLDADSLNDFDQWADAMMALNSYGTEGQANGVTVAIDTVPGDSGAFTHVEADNQIVVAITPGSFRASDLEAIVGHEGKHVEDAKTWIGCGRCAAKNPSTFDEETAGYEIGGVIAAGHFNRMNMNATYSVNAGPVGQRQRIPVWNASWGMVDFSRGLIKQAAQNVVKANGEGPDTAAGKRPAFPGAAGQWQ